MAVEVKSLDCISGSIPEGTTKYLNFVIMEKLKIEKPMFILEKTSLIDGAHPECRLFRGEPEITEITFRDVLAQTHLAWLFIENFNMLN